MKNNIHGTSLVVQWLRLHTSTTGNAGLITVQETIPICSAAQPKKKKKIKKSVCIYTQYIQTHMGITEPLSAKQNYHNIVYFNLKNIYKLE